MSYYIKDIREIRGGDINDFYLNLSPDLSIKTKSNIMAALMFLRQFPKTKMNKILPLKIDPLKVLMRQKSKALDTKVIKLRPQRGPN